MRFDVLTLFPGMFVSPFAESILGKAVERRMFELQVHNLRDWAPGRHQVTDDSPYGGGAGMVMKAEPIVSALRQLRDEQPAAPVVLLDPQGECLDQGMVEGLAQQPGLILLCARYEGADERIRAHVDREVSIGDFVLTGGELPAMVLIDAVARHLPGVLGDANSSCYDSFADGLLEHPQFTRPAVFEDVAVPQVLLSGDHAAIARWRRREQLRRTLERRPDLLEQVELSKEDRRLLAELQEQE